MKYAIKLIRDGHFDLVRQELSKRVYHRSLTFGLGRDLEKEFTPEPAKIKIQIRRLQKSDIDHLFDNQELLDKHPKLVNYQKNLIHSGIATCYVAVDENDIPCYMQWLICSDENNKLLNHFKGEFPPLDKEEALLEGAFCNPDFRGNKVMPAAMSSIAEKAKDLGVRRVRTYVEIHNIPALKGCMRAGFTPFQLRKDRWLLFRRSSTFGPIPDDLYEKYLTDMGITELQNSPQSIQSSRQSLPT